MNTNAMNNSYLQNKLETLRRVMDAEMDYIERLEYEINTFRSPGYAGFSRFDMFSEGEQEYLKEHYKITNDMWNSLEESKMALSQLRAEYQTIHDELMIRFYVSMGYIENKTVTKPVIEDSDVFDESAFGPEIYD